MRECEECGEQIPAARLKVVPNTTMCVPCQEKNDVFRVRAVITQNEEGDNEIGGIVRDKASWDKLETYREIEQKRKRRRRLLTKG